MGLSTEDFAQLCENMGLSPTNEIARMEGRAVSVEPALKRKRGPNKWEQEYAAGLESLRRIGDIDWYQFEGMSFKLADGAWFTPDFMVFRNGRLESHEVKGFFREAAKVRFKVARDKYPGITFMCFRKRKVREGGGWEQIL